MKIKYQPIIGLLPLDDVPDCVYDAKSQHVSAWVGPEGWEARADFLSEVTERAEDAFNKEPMGGYANASGIMEGRNGDGPPKRRATQMMGCTALGRTRQQKTCYIRSEGTDNV